MACRGLRGSRGSRVAQTASSVLPSWLLAAVLVPGCGPRSRQGDSSTGSSTGAASTTSTSTADATSTSGPTSTSTTATTTSTTTTTTTTTTAGDTGTGTGGAPVDYYGPCPSGLDSECPTDPWNGEPVANRCYQRSLMNGVYSVCIPAGRLSPPDEFVWCDCPPPLSGTSFGSCTVDDVNPECRLMCGFGAECPRGMVCVQDDICMWPPEGDGTGTGTGTGG